MKIGALVIGQTPRPDLTDPLAKALRSHEMIVRGALDGLSADDLPDARDAPFPLVTRLRDGTTVYLPESWLVARLQLALETLEDEGVDATILLCAGSFAQVQGSRPLVKPYDFGRTLLNTLNLNRIGLIAPFPAQERALYKRWTAAGFEVTTWQADIPNADNEMVVAMRKQIEGNALQAILIDYVGHPPEKVRFIQQRLAVPVFDVGTLAISAIASL